MAQDALTYLIFQNGCQYYNIIGLILGSETVQDAQHSVTQPHNISAYHKMLQYKPSIIYPSSIMAPQKH